MKIKKISALVLSLVMVFAMSVTAFGATEDDIKSKLEAAGLPDAYMTQVEQFLANDDLGEDDINAIIEQIDLAVETKGDAKDIASLTAEQKQAIIGNIKAAADVIGATVEIDVEEGKLVVNAGGKTYVVEATSEVVKPTGVSTTATVAVVAVMAMGIFACAVVSKKKVA